MRSYISFIFLFLCFQCFAFKADSLFEKEQDAVSCFFSNKSIVIDSSATQFLYYKIHEWIGTKYKYAGGSKNGIDCSGFVSEIYKEVYCINLTGGSNDIFQMGKSLERKELKEGDLLFFKIKRGQVSHVGIYLQNNKFAHASVQNGVIVSDLDEAYYKKYFFKGGRIVGDSLTSLH